MRRFLAMALTAAFVGTLWPAVASARLDFRAAFAMQTFGTIPGGQSPMRAFVRAPLRGLAFRAATTPTAALHSTLPQLAPPVMAYDRIFAATFSAQPYLDVSVPAPTLSLPSPATPALFAAARTADNSSSTFSLPSLADGVPSYMASLPSGASNELSAAFASQMQSTSTAIDALERVGTFRLTDRVGARLADLRTRDDRVRAATAFRVRAGDANFKIALGSEYEHLDNGTTLFPYVSSKPAASFGSTSIADLPGGSAAALLPNYANVTTRGVNAGLALPLTSHLTVGLQYGTQRYTGAYGAALSNLDASKYSYLGNLTFALPHSAAITLSAKQYRYQDNLVPFSYSQKSADLNFTVKF